MREATDYLIIARLDGWSFLLDDVLSRSYPSREGAVLAAEAAAGVELPHAGEWLGIDRRDDARAERRP